MDCDRVFMVLTSAPFPTGGAIDAPVERHLFECNDCRQLAEALRPCKGLGHEELTPDERRSLPRYRSALSPALAQPDVAHGGQHAAPTGSSYEREQTQRRDGWRAAFPIEGATPQVAAFALAPESPKSLTWDLISLLLVVGAVAMGAWGLGLFTP